MPEIGEVARMVHYLRKHLVNRTIKSCQAFEDDIVYGKVGTSASAFQKAVEGKRVTGAGQQGKYFYITLDSPPHSVMHLGMTGWIKFNAEETGYYRQAKESKEAEEWPPRFMKFLLKCESEKVDGKDRDPVEVAFVDGRRLARIRLVDCEADKIRQETPLKENGPDPVIDKDVVTVEWLSALLRKKKVPVKALFLNQANLSGVGNWVADEIMFQARIHPEQYSNTFTDEEIKRLHDALIDVCTTACETLADSTQFPANWLMKYRWDKGKKGSNVLPTGEKITHLTVGGRTSAIVPSVQKKTGAVAGDAVAENDGGDEKPDKNRKRKAMKDEEQEEEEVMPAKKDRKAVDTKTDSEVTKKTGRGKEHKTKLEDEVKGNDADKPPQKAAKRTKSKSSKVTPKEVEHAGALHSRRSARTKSK